MLLDHELGEYDIFNGSRSCQKERVDSGQYFFFDYFFDFALVEKIVLGAFPG